MIAKHSIQTGTRQPPLQSGMSLIELMIAMTLGLVVLGGVAAAFLGSKQSYRVNENLARMQESARYAFDILSKDIRMAGYYGCAGNVSAPTNLLNYPTTYAWMFNRGIYGFEATGTSTWSPSLPTSGTTSLPAEYGPDTPKSGNDIVTVRGIMGSGIRVVDEPATTAAALKVTSGSKLKEGDIVMVTNCNSSAIFQITALNPSSINFDNVVHNMGTGAGGHPPGNASNDLLVMYEGAEVVRVSTRTYYIRDHLRDDGVTTVPSLYRIVGAGAAELLVEDVEGMQIQYGVDTTSDFSVDSYRTAEWVETNGQWDNVISAQINLLVRSPDDRVANAAQTYNFNGANVTAGDRRLRQAFSSTVTLRNRTY